MGIIKAFVVFTVVVELMGYWTNDPVFPMRTIALLITALLGISFAYLLYISPRVRLILPGVTTEDRSEDEGRSSRWHSLIGRRNKQVSQQEQPDDTEITFQTARLGTHGTPIVVANESVLPVLRAQTSLLLEHEVEGMDSSTPPDPKRLSGETFSIRAQSAHATTVSKAFNHVGIFRLFSAGVRVYDLLGLFSRLNGTTARYRVRVVPNIYRISYGIPIERHAVQETLGLPRNPADALDYDRVRDYRPGDPLKTIHWKLVAHGQGEFYTKLFETPTITAVTLAIDPYGPNINEAPSELAYHLHDTMLEGSFSLIEHARENGIPGRLRFVDHAGELVQASWDGPSILGWFVETAQRPSKSRDILLRSVTAIQSLPRSGYVIFATSCLTHETVEALIACHHAGTSLLVIHALPETFQEGGKVQRSFDERLRMASVAIIGLTDGSQIVREVSVS